MTFWTAYEQSVLQSLAEFTMADFGISEAQFHNRYARGEVSRARQTFALVATDAGLPKGRVADFIKMDPSYVSQTRKRRYELRKTVEYIHLSGLISQLAGNGVPAK